MISRADLAPGHQATQAAHALAAFCTLRPALAADWAERSSYLVLLAVPDETALLALWERCAGLPGALYREPDFGDAATAFCVGPEPIGDVLSDLEARRLFANLPLLLKEPAMA